MPADQYSAHLEGILFKPPDSSLYSSLLSTICLVGARCADLSGLFPPCLPNLGGLLSSTGVLCRCAIP